MTETFEFIVVSTTVDGEAAADKLASKIVEKRLAACVQRMPVKSTYRWKGGVESAGEFLLVAKTRAALADDLVKFIGESHSYEVPEVVVTPIVGGSKPYLDWIVEETNEENRLNE